MIFCSKVFCTTVKHEQKQRTNLINYSQRVVTEIDCRGGTHFTFRIMASVMFTSFLSSLPSLPFLSIFPLSFPILSFSFSFLLFFLLSFTFLFILSSPFPILSFHFPLLFPSLYSFHFSSGFCWISLWTSSWWTLWPPHFFIICVCVCLCFVFICFASFTFACVVIVCMEINSNWKLNWKLK